jgi:CheY-like chemotaxis protein
MSSYRILVVEDDRLIARDIAMQLQFLGYQPLGPAHSGEQAIELANQLRPDLILMDVNLASVMDGIEAARNIRAQLDVPIVYLSAFTDTSNLERAKQTDPAGYLAKPFIEYQLADALSAVLNTR